MATAPEPKPLTLVPAFVSAITVPASAPMIRPPLKVFEALNISDPAPTLVTAPEPLIAPAMAVLPLPALVRRYPPLLRALEMVRALDESLVHDCAPPRVMATFWPLLALPRVTAPAPLAMVMPPVPRLRTRSVPPAWITVVAVFAAPKYKPATA